MTSKAQLKKALYIRHAGAPTRARMNKFGWTQTEFRRRGRLWEWALRVLERKPCGARRRRDGKPCQALNEPGKSRCKWHGGRSTGPRTLEGKARSLANLRQFSQRKVDSEQEQVE